MGAQNGRRSGFCKCTVCFEVSLVYGTSPLLQCKVLQEEEEEEEDLLITLSRSP